MLVHFRKLFIAVGMEARNEMRSKPFQQAQPCARATNHPDLTATGEHGFEEVFPGCGSLDPWVLTLGRSVTQLDPRAPWTDFHHGFPGPLAS